MELPRFVEVRQRFPDDAIFDCPAAVSAELDRVATRELLRPGGPVTIAVGSRGIDRHAEIVREVAHYCSRAGAVPVIVPAMGSHGGGTPESQAAILLGQGIGGRGFPAPIHSSVEPVSLGPSELGDEVWFDAEAAGADLLIVVNRIKAHTDFEGPIQSGIAKMLVVGLGKPRGAQAAHRSFRRHGFYPALTAGVDLILRRLRWVIGIALVENERHRCMRVEAIPGPAILLRERELLHLAEKRMARLPMERLDLLVVEEIGKNISGSGMDTNVISRKRDPGGSAHEGRPKIEYIYVRALSKASGGNAVGIGLADFCGERVIEAIDLEVTYLNCLTSGTPRGAALPVHLGSDRRTFEAVAGALPLERPQDLRAAWIESTLSLERFYVSEAVLTEPHIASHLERVGKARELAWDAAGNLASPFAERQD